MAVTAAGTPYVESSDLVANYPGVSLALANHIDGLDGGKVLQVVTAEYATSTSTTSATFVSTGLTATITPSSTDSKVYVTAVTRARAGTTNQGLNFSIFRGTAAGTQVGSEVQTKTTSGTVDTAATSMVLDSPSTTSAQIYTLCMKVQGGTTGFAQNGSTNAVIVLMEVGA